MKKTSTVRALTATAAATALMVGATPALAHAQDDSGITIGEPGSALVAIPSEPLQMCGTAYVGEYDHTQLSPVEMPEGAKAVAGLTVIGMNETPNLEFYEEVVTDAHGRYCFQAGPETGNAPPGMGGVLSIDESQLAAYNAQDGVAELTKTYQVPSVPELAEGEDPAEWTQRLMSYSYDLASGQQWKFDIAFDEAEPEPEPMGSVESASLQFFNLPEILRGMLHGGAMGS